MQKFLIHHRHEAHECAAAFAAWNGFASPLRHETTIGSCLAGGHEIWWQVTASGSAEALAQLPRYVAERSRAVPVRQIHTP